MNIYAGSVVSAVNFTHVTLTLVIIEHWLSHYMSARYSLILSKIVVLFVVYILVCSCIIIYTTVRAVHLDRIGP